MATKHKKILVSREAQPDPKILLGAISDVEDICRYMEQREIAKKLEELVQTEWQDIATVGREKMLWAGSEAAAGRTVQEEAN